MADEAAHRDHVDPDARSAAPNDHTHDTSHARAELAPANRYPHTYADLSVVSFSEEPGAGGCGRVEWEEAGLRLDVQVVDHRGVS
jgi:hypothetical protein